MRELITGIRLVGMTLLACSVVYPALVLGFGAAVVPERAHGSLVRDARGMVIGSDLVAQEFVRPEYLWPRPSAVGYDAMAASGSNLGAGNPLLRQRARAQVARLAAAAWQPIPAEPAAEQPIPGELVAASGSGLDPHITLAGALYQAPRIAAARRRSAARVEEVLRDVATRATPWSPPLVHVLRANLELDRVLGLAPKLLVPSREPHAVTRSSQ